MIWLYFTGERWRLQGELAVSRSIGDLPYRKFGLVFEPEFTPWRRLTPEDAFLILASDGLFESLSPEHVCRAAADISRGRPGPRAAASRPAAAAASAAIPLPGAVTPGACAAPAADAAPRGPILGVDSEASVAGTPSAGLAGCADCCRGVDNEFNEESGIGSGRGGGAEAEAGCPVEPPPRPPTLAQAVADGLRERAYDLGSGDNIAVAVVPLSPTAASAPALDSGGNVEERAARPAGTVLVPAEVLSGVDGGQTAEGVTTGPSATGLRLYKRVSAVRRQR